MNPDSQICGGREIVSVVIPTWDEEPAIAACIESVLTNEPPLDIVVSDGHSTDRTREIAASFPGVRVITSERRGRSYQMNAGAQVARGSMLWFVHADCRVPLGGALAIRTVLHDPNVSIGAFRFAVDSPGLRYRALEALVRIRSAWLHRPYGDQGLFLRRDVFEAESGFPETPILEDLRLVRSLRRSGRVHVVPEPLRTSPRRWERHGIVSVTMRNLGVLLLDRLGAAPDRLARFRRHDRK